MIAYAKDEPILKMMGRWFEDVSQLISTAYFVIDNLKVKYELFSVGDKCFYNKILDMIELLKFHPWFLSFWILSFEPFMDLVS